MKKRFYQLGKKAVILSAVAICTLFTANQTFAQGVSINSTGTGTAPDGSAILDLNITTKGFLVPRMTQAQRNAITSPANSLLIYQTDNTPGFYYNSGTPGVPVWTTFGGGSGPTAGNDIDVTGTQVDIETQLDFVSTITSAINPLTLNSGNSVIFQTTGVERGRFTTAGNFGVGDATPASLFTVGSGDLFQVNGSGNLIAINGLTGYSWPAAHASGVLRNNGTGTLTWGAPTISGVAPLTNGTIWIGNASSIATEQTMSGDVTMTNAGVTTIQANAVGSSEITDGTVANADFANMTAYSIKARATTPAGVPADFVINAQSVVGRQAADIINLTAGTDGHVLRRSGGTLDFGTIGGASFGPQTANTVFAGPTTGVAANPTFRGIVPADLAASGANGEVLGITGGALDWVATMTNPMTTTGDIIYGSTTATPSAPARVGAGTAGMVLHTNGTSGAPTWGKVDLTSGSEVTGTTNNTILIGNASGSISPLAGTNMQTLRFNTTPAPVASSNLLNNDVTIGIGGLTTAEVTSSTAKLDIDGDNTGTVSLRLRSGNNFGSSSSTQIAFGYNGGTLYEHLIKSRHQSGSTQGNALEFWLSLSGGAAVRTAFFDGDGGLSLNSLGTTNYTRIVPTAGQGANYLITLPNTVSAPGKGLVATDANGTLAWTTVGSGTVTIITPGTGIVGSTDITTTGTIAVDAANGLTADAGEDKVELGGTLDENTTIAQGNFNMIHNLTGTGDFDVQVGGSTQFIVDATTGNIGIGGTAVTHKLTINGKVKSTGINETSDARLKTNFASIDGALNKILSMNGKYYDWRTSEFPNKGLEEGRQVGVIAQEIEKILPEVVDTDSEGYKSVEYGHIVPVLIEAIKEQQKIIDGQNTTITDLKASLENVLNRVNIIEKNTDLNSSKVEK